ncbi:type VI secretion system tip protein VgrG [Burkholderia stagnalis]|nr:type VI secretion system tip protein VgrG [Burkholderia stagnalis]RQX85161.1 type VI secretion system tip protein VgrG [Burkholderia stagnalis]RQY74515.1 type VI secretion system tip protein VgrG [Burkholderia stagnalis]
MFEQYVRERQNKRIERALLEEHKKAAVRLFETNLDALRKAFACSPVSLQSTPLPSYPGAMWMGHIGINAFSVTQDIEVEQFPVYFNLVAAGRERVGQHQFVRDGSIHTFFCSADRRSGKKVNLLTNDVELVRAVSAAAFNPPPPWLAWYELGSLMCSLQGDAQHWYLDTKGRYVVQLHLDMDDRVPGLNSCEMRLAKPFAGPNHSGFHFGLVEGTEVTVAFHNGNPDFPYISQVLHNSEEPDPIVAGYPWGMRNTIRTRSNNTFEMDDREGKEHIKVATEHGKSQLNLGYTVDRDNRTRGEGFELRTDMQGSVRAGGGVFVSADSQPAARGVAADMRPASDQFRLTQAEVQQLAELARTATAEVADLRAENAWLREAFSELQQSVIALSAPNGIGMATPNRVMVSAGKDVSVSTSDRFNVSAMRNIVMAAKNVVSVFAHQMGIRLLAARGNVTIQSQSDGVDIASRQDTSIRSTSGRVVIEAKNEILLKCGGSYMRLTPNNLTNATLGDYVEKAVAWEKRNPDGRMKKDTLPFSTDVPDLHQHGSRFSG